VRGERPTTETLARYEDRQPENTMTVDTRSANDSSIFDTAPRGHDCDADCAEYLVNGECTICGAYHGDPCPDCNGRGYHLPDCNHVDEET